MNLWILIGVLLACAVVTAIAAELTYWRFKRMNRARWKRNLESCAAAQRGIDERAKRENP
jgi:predicted outer membrane lipoprotein